MFSPYELTIALIPPHVRNAASSTLTFTRPMCREICIHYQITMIALILRGDD